MINMEVPLRIMVLIVTGISLAGSLSLCHPRKDGSDNQSTWGV